MMIDDCEVVFSSHHNILESVFELNSFPIVSIFVVGDSYPNGPRTSNEAIETKKTPNRAPDHSTDFKTSFDQVSTRNTYRL